MGLGLFKVIKLRRRHLAIGAVLIAAVLLTICVFSPERQEVRASSDNIEAETISIPIVMYHSVTSHYNNLGDYVIADYEFENDVEYLHSMGYEAIVVQDLIDYTKGGKLPEKPIMLTFDDAYFDNYSNALETVKKYNYKFVMSSIGVVADQYQESKDENTRYAHLSWDRLLEMEESGYVEVQSHSYNMHTIDSRKGVQRKQWESEADYREAIMGDIKKSVDLAIEHLGKAPTAFAYPFGKYSDTTDGIMKELGFKCTFTCNELISKVSRNPDSLFSLGRYLRPSGVDSKDFFENKMKLG